ncbi:MAG: HDOD domain-containing protein [Pseudomonadales bacterium]|nr:HDOD domain-containing protein [Pseudomonadales bacterium]
MSLMDVLFEANQHLPAMSSVVQSLITSFEDPDVDIDDIARQISRDQALTAKVLRLANTAAYGGNRKISSVNDAVLVMGFNTLRTLVLSCGLVNAFKAPSGFDIRRFWQQSFKTAATCAWLARTCRQNQDAAFTVGLLHNMGDILIFMGHPDIAAEVEKTVSAGGVRSEVELHLLGFDYAEVGSELARRWRFPEAMVRAIAEQESPMSHEPTSSGAIMIFLGKILAQATQSGVVVERLPELLPRPEMDALHLNIDVVLTRYSELAGMGEDLASLVM